MAIIMSKSLMKKTTAVVLSSLLALSSLFSFTLTADAKAKKYVKSIKVAKKSFSINVGKSKSVKVTVKVVKKASKKFTVKSSKKSVATAKVSGSKVKISAKKAGKATITVTTKAKGKKGKKLSAKIKVTVVKGKASSITTYESASSFSNPFVIGNGSSASLFDLEPVFNYYSDQIDKDATMFSSDDESVVSVNSKGIITGHKVSDIPVAVSVMIFHKDGTPQKIISYVKVSDNAPISPSTPTAPVSSSIGIASFGATSAKILTVRFTAPVASADRSKLDITVKKGSATLSLAKEWADDYTVNFTAGSELEATNYTASIDSSSLNIDSSKKSASCSVAKNEIKDVKITTKRVAKVNNVRIYFDAIDIYGNKMEGTAASKFNWQINCADAKVKTSLISKDESKKDYIALTNFGSDSIGIEADSTVLGVQAILKTNADIKSGESSIEVKSLKIAKVEIEGIALTDGATRVYQEASDKTYKLLYTAVDQYGDPIDWSLYIPGSSNSAYSNSFNAYSNNTDLVTAPTIKDGELVITVKANKTGKAQIYAVVDDPNPKVYNVEVLESAKPQRINFPDSSAYSVVAGENKELKVPVTFIDQYGYDMVKGAVSTSKFNSTFTGVIKSDNNLVVGYVSNNEGDFVTFNAKNLSYSTTQSVNVTFSTYDSSMNLISSTFTIKVDPERAPAVIKFTNGGVPASLLAGETAKVEYQIMDNRSEEWKSNANLNVVVDINDTTYLSCSYSAVASDGTGSITLKGKADSTGNSNPATTLKIRLVYKSNTIAESSYSVVVNPNLSDIKMSVSPTTVNAGQNVTLTLTAYKNSTTILDAYNRTYSDVTVTQTDEADSANYKTDFKDITFVNGVAKVQVEAKVAAESVQFSTQIKAAGGSTFNVNAAEKVKINAGTVQSYNLNVKDVTVGGKKMTQIAVTAVDKYGNTVKSYSPSGSSYITIKNKNNEKLDPSTYFSDSKVDSNGKVLLTFTDGTAGIASALNYPLPSGAAITVTTGSITGSATK